MHIYICIYIYIYVCICICIYTYDWSDKGAQSFNKSPSPLPGQSAQDAVAMGPNWSSGLVGLPPAAPGIHAPPENWGDVYGRCMCVEKYHEFAYTVGTKLHIMCIYIYSVCVCAFVSVNRTHMTHLGVCVCVCGSVYLPIRGRENGWWLTSRTWDVHHFCSHWPFGKLTVCYWKLP